MHVLTLLKPIFLTEKFFSVFYAAVHYLVRFPIQSSIPRILPTPTLSLCKPLTYNQMRASRIYRDTNQNVYTNCKLQDIPRSEANYQEQVSDTVTHHLECSTCIASWTKLKNVHKICKPWARGKASKQDCPAAIYTFRLRRCSLKTLFSSYRTLSSQMLLQHHWLRFLHKQVV